MKIANTRISSRARVARASVAALAAAMALSWASYGVAQLAPAAQTGPPTDEERRAGESVTAAIESLVGSDWNGAQALAQQAVAEDPSGAWGYYVRGAALVEQKRTDDAVSSFRDAELRFPEADLWGRAVALWGQAYALQEARPCRDAHAAFERFIAFVAPLDAAAAARGRELENHPCVTPPPAPYSMLDPAFDFYRRGDALLRERRYGDAVASYRQAEAQLPASNVWGRSIAIWGQANALAEAGRCDEAAPIYLRYAQYVQSSDPRAAAMGRSFARRRCAASRRQ